MEGKRGDLFIISGYFKLMHKLYACGPHRHTMKLCKRKAPSALSGSTNEIEKSKASISLSSLYEENENNAWTIAFRSKRRNRSSQDAAKFKSTDWTESGKAEDRKISPEIGKLSGPTTSHVQGANSPRSAPRNSNVPKEKSPVIAATGGVDQCRNEQRYSEEIENCSTSNSNQVITMPLVDPTRSIVPPSSAKRVQLRSENRFSALDVLVTEDALTAMEVEITPTHDNHSTINNTHTTLSSVQVAPDSKPSSLKTSWTQEIPKNLTFVSPPLNVSISSSCSPNWLVNAVHSSITELKTPTAEPVNRITEYSPSPLTLSFASSSNAELINPSDFSFSSPSVEILSPMVFERRPVNHRVVSRDTCWETAREIRISRTFDLRQAKRLARRAAHRPSFSIVS